MRTVTLKLTLKKKHLFQHNLSLANCTIIARILCECMKKVIKVTMNDRCEQQHFYWQVYLFNQFFSKYIKLA